ncbi:carboxypeptidase regulatory-like domain-containing protein [candidate division WOR-3 bacterium]|nr:carboxypeptidase regulatory-like domain-containing protein [candidate division WOR-3 bacterium]
MKRRILGILTVIVVLLGPGLAFGVDISGVLKGQVKDASTGKGLGFTAVQVTTPDGKSVGGTYADGNGNFLISNIYPGVYKVEFSCMGYKSYIVDNVKISSSQTVSLYPKLRTDVAVRIDVVVINPTERFFTGSKEPTRTGEEIKTIAGVHGMGDVVSIEPGAVNIGAAGSDEIHVLGGRENELVYMVDGINANDPVTGQSGVDIDNNSIQEVRVNTGNFNAKYGNAMGGVVEIVTREGTKRYTGILEYETDGGIRTSKDPIKFPNENMFHQKASAAFGGPLIPGRESATFFVSGNWTDHENRLPFRDQHRLNGTLKLTWAPMGRKDTLKTGGLPKFTLSGNYSDLWYHSYVHSMSKGVWLEQFGPRTQRGNYQLNLNVNHSLSEKLIYNINIGTFNTHTSFSYQDGAHYNDFKQLGRQQLAWVGWAMDSSQGWWESLSDTIVLEDTIYTETDTFYPGDVVVGDTIRVKMGAVRDTILFTDKTWKTLFDPSTMTFTIPDENLFLFLTNEGDTINVKQRYSALFPDTLSVDYPDSLVWLFYNEYVNPRGFYKEGDKAFSWFSWADALEALNERWYEVNEWRPSVVINIEGADTTYDTVGVHYHLFDYDLYRHYYELWRDWDSIIIDQATGDTIEVENPYEDSLEGSGNMYYCRYNSDPLFRRFSYYYSPVWSERSTTNYQGDISVTWLPDTINRIEVGVNGTFNDLEYSSIQFINENPYSDDYHVKPISLAAYISDVIRYEDLELDAGLRFDYFDPKSEYYIDEDNIDSGKAPTDAKLQFSPRLSLSFAVSDKANMYASYGHMFQPVVLSELYQNMEADITTGVPLLGNPNLPPEKTIFYEAGYEQALDEGKNWALTLKAYYRDQENLLATREVTTLYKRKLASYTVYQIEDFAKIKGVDIGVRKVRQRGTYFSGYVVYTFMDAKGTGSSGREFYYRYRGSTLQPPKHEYPLEFDVPHSVKANLNFNLPVSKPDAPFLVRALGDFNFNVMFSAASGHPYWATDSKGNPIPLGTRRTPPVKSLDLRLEKWFGLSRKEGFLGRTRLGFYFDVTNVFDWENVVYVYSNTGLADDHGDAPVFEPALYRNYARNGFLVPEQDWEADLADWEAFYGQNPGNYGDPRIMRFGVRVSF